MSFSNGLGELGLGEMGLGEMGGHRLHMLLLLLLFVYQLLRFGLSQRLSSFLNLMKMMWKHF